MSFGHEHSLYSIGLLLGWGAVGKEQCASASGVYVNRQVPRHEYYFSSGVGTCVRRRFAALLLQAVVPQAWTQQAAMSVN